MAEIIVAVFDTTAHADAAEASLRSGGIPASIIHRYQPGDANAPIDTSSTTERTEPEYRGFWASLFGSEEHEDRSLYEEHVSAGRTIVSVHTVDAAQTTEVMRILESHSPDEMQAQRDRGVTERSGMRGATHGEDRALSETSRSGMIESATPATASTPGKEQVIPLTEEQLDVGKRTIDRGTTRIRRYTVDRPVEETVGLRDQTTTIERRAPVSGTTAEATPFEERTVEVHETSEVPVVSKTAKVAEEVVVRTDATERKETVRDTVRREQVDVDKAGSKSPTRTP